MTVLYSVQCTLYGSSQCAPSLPPAGDWAGPQVPARLPLHPLRLPHGLHQGLGVYRCQLEVFFFIIYRYYLCCLLYLLAFHFLVTTFSSSFFLTFHRQWFSGRLPGPDPRGYFQLSELCQPESGRMEVCHRLGCSAGSAGKTHITSLDISHCLNSASQSQDALEYIFPLHLFSN